MDFKDLSAVLGELTELFGRQVQLTVHPAGPYAAMCWPRAVPLLRFDVHRYDAAGYGSVFCMATRAAGGLMRLATFVCTPAKGTDVPLLLADIMAMGKKRAVFVEYYDCTAAGADVPALRDTARRYAALEDYPEKPAWYVPLRAPYSLIKGGAQEAALLQMLRDSVQAYAGACAAKTQSSEANREKLRAFADRMVRDKNPSSAVLERALGPREAERFFRTMVMPVQSAGETYTLKQEAAK